MRRLDMRTRHRTILAGAIIAATLGFGCVAIISSDDRHHHEDDCSDCHYTVVEYGKQVADTTATTDESQAR
jgi:D-serine dehydratase